MITIRPDATEFRQKFPVLIAQARNPRALLLGVGREGANFLKNYFRQKDQTNVNKLAPDRRQHLWLRISRSVQAPVVNSDTSVSISINDPVIAQKVFGGPIVAKRVKNLSIPLEADAYGRTPGTYERETGFKLFLIKSNNQLLLVRAAGEQGVKVEYLLTHRVNQVADPSALPDERLLLEKLLLRGQSIIDRQIALN